MLEPTEGLQVSLSLKKCSAGFTGEIAPMGNLEEFLEGERAQGSRDSGGNFSIDSESARNLYRQAVRANRAVFLFRAIQFAVAAGARAIEVAFTEVSVQLFLNIPNPGPEIFQTGHFRWALLTGLETGCSEISWGFPGGSIWHEHSLNGSGEAQSTRARQDGDDYVELEFVEPQASPLWGWWTAAKRAEFLTDELKRLCSCCPVSIHLHLPEEELFDDVVDKGTIRLAPSVRKLSSSRHILIRGCHVGVRSSFLIPALRDDHPNWIRWGSGGFHDLPALASERPGLRRYSYHSSGFLPSGESTVRADLCISLRSVSQPRDSALHFIKDGVFLSEPLPARFPGRELVAMIADCEIKTDASGMQAVADERVEEWKAFIGRLLAQAEGTVAVD